jgi:hypothetical protein
LPDKILHLKKAADNEALSLQLDRQLSSAPNWAIVMTFYAAVHYVEAYFFVTQHHDHKDHTVRDSAIKNDPKISPLWRPYARLKNASIQARYEHAFFTSQQFLTLRPNLDQIKGAIGPLL